MFFYLLICIFVAMKLSIIIPVYLVEDTLDRCVESVLRQHVNDMEVILVDDGSPDKCPQKCDNWAKKDKRIRVIHKENGGLSDARNAALDIAIGEYITFVDSDDWISPDTYAPLLEMIGDNDLLEYTISGRPPLKDVCYENINEYWLQAQVYTHCFACNKIFRRQLFEGVRFPKGRIFEDVYALPQLLRKARKVCTTSLGLYYYTDNTKSITATAGGEGLTLLLETHLQSSMPIDDHYYMYLVNIQMDVWEQTGKPIILPLRHVNASILEGRQKAKAILLNILGINTLCKINKLIHRFKKPSRW